MFDEEMSLIQRHRRFFGDGLIADRLCYILWNLMLDYVDGSLEHKWTSQTFSALKLLDWTQPVYTCSKVSGFGPSSLYLL
jgi:hypothetical protein